MLTKEGAKFEVLELDERKDGDAIQAALFKMTGRRTVPNGAWMSLLVLDALNRALCSLSVD